MGVVTHTVNPDGGADYTSLSAWDATENGNLVTGARDGEIATAVCHTGGSADTTAFDLDGWTTDADGYCSITIDSAHRHAGVWDANKYRLIAANWHAIQIYEDYTRIDGLQIGFSGTITYDIGAIKWKASGLHAKVSNCIVQGHTTVGYSSRPTGSLRIA